MTSKNHKAFVRFTRMNAEELAAATADLDEEFAADKFREPTPSEVKSWQRAKRGRPTVGKGAKAISVSIETGLLGQADRHAKKLNISRSELIARSLTAFMKGGDRAAGGQGTGSSRGRTSRRRIQKVGNQRQSH